MRKIQLTHISVLQTARVLGILYVVLGLIYIPLGWLADSAAAPGERLGAFWLLMPVILGVFGFIVVVLAASLYNVVAARVGGVEFSLSGDLDQTSI